MPDNLPTLRPRGSYDGLPAQVKRQAEWTQAIEKVYQTNGYQRVKTPMVEFVQTLSAGVSGGKERILTFLDDQNRLMGLRSDHTAPIARLVATHYKSAPLPIRLSYMDSVFRRSVHGQVDDIFQTGVECVGQSSPAEMAAMIRMHASILTVLGCQNIVFDVGHAKGLMAYTEVEKAAILAGDYVTLGHVPLRNQCPPEGADPSLHDLKTILDQSALPAVVMYNAGLVKDNDYYTGIVMDCYVGDCRHAVGSGGQYDHLLEKFGRPMPACGFALNLTVLQQGLASCR